MPEGVKFTEDFQAKAFVDLQDDNIRYVEENDRWYKHNSVYWEEMSRLDVIELVRLMNRGTRAYARVGRLT
jgi:hypothetical protein